jgi:hypothetical protein
MTGKVELILCPQKSALDGLITYDWINEKLLKKCLNSTLLEDSLEWDETKQLKKYMSKYTKSDKKYFVEVINARSKGLNYGRVVPQNNLGLSHIRREIRHTITTKDDKTKYYYDIDIVNCHYAILSQICSQNGLKTDAIDKYIKDREKILKNLMEETKIDRSKAKQLFIAIIYGASFEKWKKDNNIILNTKSKSNKFIEELKLNIETVRDTIIEKNPKIGFEVEKNKILKNQRYYNYEASFLSTYLQEYECRILECMYLYFLNKNMIKNKICTLCADGIMIPKENIDDIDETMKELEKVLEKTTGFKLKLEQKEMDQDYLEELEDKQIKKDDDDKDFKTYEEVKKEFEKTNFKVKTPLLYCSINSYGELVLRNKTDFSNVYENLFYKTKKYNDEGEEIVRNCNFINSWLKDEEMRTYEKMDFLPCQKAPKDVYNTFDKFEILKKIPSTFLICDEEGTIDNTKIKPIVEKSLIYKHLHNLCGNDDKVMDYVLKVLSRKIKQPHKLTNTAILFKSNPGSGKDTFFNWFGNKIIGREYYFNNSDSELLFGKFNSELENKILCVLNEVSYKETIEIVEKLKDRITNPINKIQHKGLKTYTQTNHATYIMLTNKSNPLQIETHDRRYLTVESNNDICNNAEYFKALNEEMNSEEYDYIFYLYLKNINSDDYDFTGNRPETEFNKELKEHNIPVMSRFLEDLYLKNNDKVIKILKYNATDLYNKFDTYIQQNKIKSDMSNTQFGLQLRSYKSIEKKRNNKGNSYEVNIPKIYKELVKMKHMEPIPEMELDEDNDSYDETDTDYETDSE